jgi:hypothetical protein
MAPSPHRPLKRRGFKEFLGGVPVHKNVEMEEMIRMCTVNVGTMVGRSREVVEMLARSVDVYCVLVGTRVLDVGRLGVERKSINSGGRERKTEQVLE